MDIHGEEDLFEAQLPSSPAFVFGNEARGLPAEILSTAERRVRVPHAGRAESLNLAAAATVCPGWTMHTAKNRFGCSIRLPVPNALRHSRLLYTSSRRMRALCPSDRIFDAICSGYESGCPS